MFRLVFMTLRVRCFMRLRTVFMALVAMMLLLPVAQAHEQKTLTVILVEDGSVNGNISDAAFVQGNAVWFRMEDSSNNASLVVHVDVDMDGTYNETHDFASPMLYNSCELDENGSKVNDACFTSSTYAFAANATVGNYTYWVMQYQNGTNTTRTYNIAVHEDVHVEDGPTAGDCFGIGCDEVVQDETETDTETTTAAQSVQMLLAILALVGMIGLSLSIISERRDANAESKVWVEEE